MTTADIRLQLKAEGYRTESVCGPILMKQLRAVLDDKAGPPAKRKL